MGSVGQTMAWCRLPGCLILIATAIPAAAPLRYETRHFDRKLPGCGNAQEGCAHVEIEYVEVAGGPEPARQRINSAIRAYLLEQPNDDRKLTLEEYADGFIKDYRDFRKRMDVGGPWYLDKSVTVLRTKPVFSLQCSESSYSGGAHPSSSTQHLNFDPATGEPVTLKSILKDGALARLTAIAEAHFRQARKLAPTADLAEEGFNFPNGRFQLNDNYGFEDKALVFVFNPYEIAAYAAGPTAIEIPYTEIRDLLLPGFAPGQ